MKNDFEIYACRVCGLLQPEPPWGPDQNGPTWIICSCCGTEFGYEDCSVEAAKAARQRWIDGGMKWFDRKERPRGWSFERQMKNIPQDFR